MEFRILLILFEHFQISFKMLLDYGADINSIYRTARNVVMTPLDCSLQKGLRSTAKFLQLHGGLPASKLRLSGRNPNAINDQELVRPLNFGSNVEAQPATANRSNDENKKRIVVYVKRSDSEEYSCDEQVPKRYHKSRTKCEHQHRHSHTPSEKQASDRHHHRHTRRHRYRFRTSSCETFAAADHHRHKDDSSSDICRSKSNIEIRRRCKSRNKKDSTSVSEGSSTDSISSECPCKHNRRGRYKQCHHEERSLSRRKKSRVENDSAAAQNGDVCKKRHKKLRKPDDTSTEDNEIDDKKTNKTAKKEKSDMTKNDANKNSLENSPAKDKKTKSSSNNDQRSAAIVVSKSDNKRPQSAKGSAGKSRSDARQITDVPVDIIPAVNEENIEKIVNFSKETVTPINNENVIFTKADVHVSSILESIDGPKETLTDKLEKSDNQPDKTENLADKDDGNLTDSTFTVESTKLDNKIDESISKEIIEADSKSKPPHIDEDKEIAEETSTSHADSTPQENLIVAQIDDAKKSESPVPVNDLTEPHVLGTPEQNSLNTDTQIEDTSKVVVRGELSTSLNQADAVELQLPTIPDEDQPRKSSFTVLASDESVDLVDDFEADSASIIERRKSFKVLSSVEKEKSDDEDEESYTTEDEDVDEPNANGRQVAGSASATASDRSNRRKRLKKRAKLNIKQYSVDVANDILSKATHQQQSKDHDSGFEPSPRAMRTKIPSPRTVYTAVMPRKSTSGVVDGRSCSSRLEGRKPGDKNSVNMTTVTQSIQRNIKRYVNYENIWEFKNV